MLAIALATMMAVQNPDSMTMHIETTVLGSTPAELSLINGIITSGYLTDSATIDGTDFMLFYNYDRDTCVAMEDDDRAIDLTLRLYVND
tara:strand:+ start:23 stop:289 length:267 start_codon:yes stop_codon:yes gene_type:complete